MEKIRQMLKKNTMLAVLLFVYLFFIVTTGGSILRPLNFSSLIIQSGYVYILGIGMMILMLCGGNIDLSCGSFVCLLGALGGIMMNVWGWSVGMSLGLLLLLSLIYGGLLGFLIAYVRIPPWIASLTGYLAFRGLGTSLLTAHSPTGSIAPLPENFLQLFSGKLFQTRLRVFNWPCMAVGIVAAFLIAVVIFRRRAMEVREGGGTESLGSAVARCLCIDAAVLLVAAKMANAGGVPVVLIWVAAAALIYSYVTEKTVVGRQVYAVGGNEGAAQLSGIHTKRVVMMAYVNMALLTALAAFMTAARFQASNPMAGNHFEMDAVSACVVGGVSVRGGAGNVKGVLIGATLIGVINLGMSLMGIDVDFQSVIRGLVLLGAVLFDVLRGRAQ